MSPAEIRAFNAGVDAVLGIAKQSAQVIQTTSKRPIAEAFAIAALAELAAAAEALKISAAPTQPAPTEGAAA